MVVQISVEVNRKRRTSLSLGASCCRRQNRQECGCFIPALTVNFGLTRTPDHNKANMRAYMWDQMKDWLLHGAIHAPAGEALGSPGEDESVHLRPSSRKRLDC